MSVHVLPTWNTIWLSYQERTVDTWALAAEEGRSKQRNAAGRSYILRSAGLRMGQPCQSNVW